jgi:hypothetical protein
MTHREHISNRLFLIKSILDLNRIELKESVYHLHRHNEAVAKQPSQMRQNASKTGRGGDKGMPNGWSFNWGSMTTKERAGLETRCVESLLVVYLCVSLLCLGDAEGDRRPTMGKRKAESDEMWLRSRARASNGLAPFSRSERGLLALVGA